MNSSQLNFFINNNDLEAIEDFLKRENCMIFDSLVKSIDSVGNGELKSHSGFPKPQVYFQDNYSKKKIYYKYQQSKNYYFIDETRSPVIQFSIGGIIPASKKELYRSRFYFIHQYYDNNGNIISKDEDLKQWAIAIFKKFKNTFLITNEKYKNILFSKNALEWIMINNASLSFGGLKFIAP